MLNRGSKSNRVKLVGDRFPMQMSKADLDFGPGVSARRIVSHTATQAVVELDVSADAATGKRTVSFCGSILPESLAVYDRVDYIKVLPDSAMAAFGGETFSRGYQQFEAIGYLNGPDGKRHTEDDIALGPVDVTWSIKRFYESADSRDDFVGSMSPKGLFTPAAESPKNNFDVWVVAESRDRGNEAKPTPGKSYLVVTVPVYTFNGRRYVRDLDRWVDDGPAQPTGGTNSGAVK